MLTFGFGTHILSRELQWSRIFLVETILSITELDVNV